MDGIQEQPAGALTQIGAAQAGKPDPAMNPQGALQNFALAQAEKKQSYLEKVQDAYNRDMNQYAQMVEQSRQPEASEAGRWGSIAQGFSSVAPTWGNTGAMLGKSGAEYGKFVDQTQQQDVKNQGDLTKIRQAELRALESKDQSAAMMKQLYGQNKGFEPRKNSDGTTTVYDKNTGLPVGTYGPQDIGKLTQLTQTLAKAAVEKGEYATLDEATHWAHTEALRLIEDSNAKMGNRTKPLAGDVGGLPTTKAAPATQTTQSLPTPATQATLGTVEGSDKSAILGDELAKEGKALSLASASGDSEASALHRNNIAQLQEMIAALPPTQKADVERNFQRYVARPNTGTLKGVESALTRTGAMPKLDIVRQAGEKETSVDTAKTYEGLFADNVAKPAVAFANTGKIMQDFNTLGQMNHALKNGKFKEFMAGETGKYALSFLPADSELRKGIANAQEAEKLTAGMVNQILLAAKGVQTEGDAQRARSQVTSIGTDPDANAYLEAYISETARQLKMREQAGLAHKNKRGTFEGYDDAWSNHPLMKDAKGSVKKLGSQWIGATQYIDKFKAKNPGATDSDAVQSWNRVK
jgi:hypothetical protein